MLLNRALKIQSNYHGELVKATAIVADNVAEYFYVTNDQEYWDLRDDFPNVAPPWPNIWFEYSVPRYINSEEFGYYKNPDWEQASRLGALLLYRGIDDYKLTTEVRRHYIRSIITTAYIKNLEDKGFFYDKISDVDRAKADRFMLDGYKQAYNDPNVNRFVEEMFIRENIQIKEMGVKWVFIARHFMEMRNGPVVEVASITQAFIDEQGRFKGVKGDQSGGILVAPEKYMHPEDREKWASHQGKWLHIPFMTLCFCHCKNVEAVEYRVQEGQKSQRQKKKGTAVYKYYVLNIDPMKKTLRDEGESEKTGLKKALHICRGHFATYSSEKPLFGRSVGTFWRPMHTRGSKERGRVFKDYKVGGVPAPPNGQG